jgi:hypothetical protein
MVTKMLFFIVLWHLNGTNVLKKEIFFRSTDKLPKDNVTVYLFLHIYEFLESDFANKKIKLTQL